MERSFANEMVFRLNKLKYVMPKLLGREIALTYPGIKYPFYLRRGTSDFTAFKYVIANEEYQVGFKQSPKVIIDAGANIGLAAVYFANLYPEAKILSIEAEKSNFEILKKNVSPYKNIIPIHAALWDKLEELDIMNPDSDNWGFQTGKSTSKENTNSEKVKTTTMDQLIKDYNLNSIDLLKIDIEGAEVEVFSHANPWIEKVSTIAIELHDRFKPGCTEVFDSNTKDFQETWTRGENIFKTRSNEAYSIM